MSSISERIAGLSPEKLAQLSERLKGRPAAADAARRIPRRAGGSPAPLSYAQQRLWFLDQLEPGSAAYNIPAALRLEGRLDAVALEDALREIVRRHESLRTTFEEVGGEPAQIIRDEPDFTLLRIDLSVLSPEERDAELSRLMAEEARRPFDLARGPLLRVALVRLAAESHLALFTLHHIVSDGWSHGVLTRELGVLYEAFAAGRPSPLAELPIQYADYSLWQRERLSGAEFDRQLGYWRERLRDAPALDLPADRPRPGAQSFRGNTLPFEFDAELSGRLNELSRREGVTLFMTLLAAFKALLSRHAGQEDIVVGTPGAGRQLLETEGLIGFFVNTLVLRTDVSGDPTFRELLARERETALGAFTHQDVPFEMLVEELQPERSLSRSPLFQVMFALQNAPRETLELPGLRLTAVPSVSETAKFDLTLSLGETEAGLSGSLNYASDLFDDESAARLVSHFENLLRGVVADSGQKLSALPLLSEDERRQILVGWNDARHEYPAPQCIHELFEQQVGRTPDAPAVVSEGGRLSYAELDARANQLAHHLKGLGVGPESLVGVCLERTSEMVAALLGVLKAGGAYVPLDPVYPQERVRFMLADAGVRVLLTQESLLDRLPRVESTVICVDWDAAAVAHESDTDPAVGATQWRAAATGDLAYVIYTSGSTGTPKGVAIEHRSVSTLLRWAHETFSAEELAGVLASTSVCFDLSIFELFAPLTCGGAVVLAQNALELPGLAAASEVTLVNTVPSAMAELVRLDGVPASVKTVNLAGEPLKRALVEQVYGGTRAARVWNLYGPSEDTTYSTCELVERGGEGEPTIGRPVANTQAYLLDRYSCLVPRGAVGELYLGGEGLSRGYLNRPALTAERYVPDPFSGEPGARLYRTGDLARWRRDGELEFLGRADHQVKVRGFRIELGEVEAAIAAHEGVRECVVVAREDEGGDKSIVAYVATGADASTVNEAAAGGTLSSAALRARLRERLPEYMVPSLFVFLGELPLTPNGKVDRKALPAPGRERQELEREFVAPRDEVEGVLCGIWSEVLRVERVGAEDNFFELGGHSLLATRLIARAREALGVELPLRALFETPTVAGLARAVREEKSEGRGATAQAIRRAPRDSAPPLSYAQQRLWFLDQLEPGSAAYNIPAALRLEGRLDAAALERSLREIVRRHESLRTTFQEVGGEPAQVISPEAGLSFRVVSLEDLPPAGREAEARRLALEEARRPFDLARGPLLRAALVRLAAESHLALFTLHHIVSDGWSHGVLTRELAVLYAAFSAGLPSPLEELPIQYADYAAWQRGRLSGDELERQLGYWRGRLRDAPALDLPTDRARPAAQSSRGKTLPLTLDTSLSEALKELSRREGATLFMTLLAAFQALLSRHTGQEDLVVGTPVAGRQLLETEGLIGFFVNTLALRTDLSGDPTFRELLARVRETALGAYAHQDVPFERLVEELQPERDLSRAPLFQVMFGLQNTPRETLELPGLRLSAAAPENETAKFDLTLLMHETPRGLASSLNYAADLFNEERAARLVSHFENLLGGIAADPGRRLSALPLLSEGERRAILVGCNHTRREYRRELCVHQLFEAQAARTPERDALTFGGARLTYAELNRRADRLAAELRARGVGADGRVAICLRRSFEMIVAVVAVLKAGGAYVPLDPDYPQERLEFMLADAGARVLLTERRLASRLRACGAEVICMGEDPPAPSAQAGAIGAARAATPESLAYVIYTSGSTGRPKGAAMPHRPLVNLVEWQLARSAGAPRTLQFTSLSFDVSFQEIFSTLCAGATLVLIGEDERRDPAALLRVLREGRVERLFLPFVALQLLAETAEREGGAPGCLREVITAGEQLKITWQLRTMFAGARTLDNQYGPSETHVASAHMLAGDSSLWPGLPPVGRPIANSEAYVLDARQGPVPVGVAGEIYLGGDCLARGYLERADATAERFVPHPFAARVGHADAPPAGGARLYRTGDLGRLLPGGEIEFLGRADDQVKIRGYRVEPGEVEAALRDCGPVRDCAVVARKGERGEPYLAAYVITAQAADARAGRTDPAPATEATAAELRRRLKERLPDYMIPSAFVFLEEFPLTPSGKVDRRALPEPERAGSPEEYAAPLDPAEEILTELWAEVLGVGRVGRAANFFELGGHSLLATRLVSRVREAFGVELPLRRLFEEPTVAGLARAVREEKSEGRGVQTRAISRAPREPAPPLSFAQQRFWFLDQLDPGNSLYNVPLAVRLTGALDADALEDALREVARRHEALRTTFVAADGHPAQVVSAEASFALDVTDFSGLDDGERERAARRFVAEEAARPFDLARGPAWRARLARLGAQEHILCVVMHHIISDGWSMGVLVSEAASFYAARVMGERASLPGLPIQYADYAVWQRERLDAGELERQTEYWRAELAGAPPTLDLPTDRPRPAAQTFRGRAHSFELPPELHARLKELSRREGVTLFMTLLAGFEVLLARHSGQEDFVVGAGVAGRNAVELEGLVGCFVNFLALRSRVAAALTVRELLRAVREQTLAAHAHQDIPFEVLLERLQPERRPGYPPLFHVTFFYQNVPRPAVEMPGLKIEPLAAPASVAKFDLMLVMDERGDRLGGLFEYNTDLFNDSTVARLTTHFTNLLREMAADPDREVDELALADEAATRRLSDTFGGEIE
jgi:amino acid adenylation domain-containing protein